MESKIGAAELAAAGGVPAWIASPTDLPELLAGRDAGTFFPAGDRGEPAFKLWLRHGKRMVGAVASTTARRVRSLPAMRACSRSA